MHIIGATKQEIEAALETTNGYFEGNIMFKTMEYLRKSRQGKEVFTLTLTVKDSNEIGSRRSEDGRRIAAACWHAHGVFFDSLPAGTEIRTTRQGPVTIHAGDRWQDMNIGSNYKPLMASRACNCMDWNTGGVLPFPVNQ